MGRYSDIKWENLSDNGSNADKITPVTKEMIDYYKSHGYEEKGIPLNADTCREIALELDKENS